MHAKRRTDKTPGRLGSVAALLAVALAAGLAGGCGSGQITGAEAKLPADEDSSAFLDRLSSADSVSTDDALRGIVMLTEGEDTYDTFQQRVEALRAAGILVEHWDLAAAEPITRGRYAVLIHQAAGLPMSVMLLAGPSERYCLRELQYRGMMVQGAPYITINGLEYVSVLRRADVYKRTGEVPDASGSTDDL